MPIGVLVNVSAVFLGSIIGALMGKHIPKGMRDHLPVVFGFCAMTIGIVSIVKIVNLPSVVLASILGFAIGDLLHLESRTEQFFSWLVEKTHIGQGTNLDMELYITAVAVFCCSGMGIFGVLTEGMSGNHSILFSKAILDFFTAMIFAISLGYATALIALPQLLIMLVLFFISSFVSPHISSVMFADFTACGGLLTVATAFRMAKIKSMPIINLIPALILVFPISHLWTTYVVF